VSDVCWAEGGRTRCAHREWARTKAVAIVVIQTSHFDCGQPVTVSRNQSEEHLLPSLAAKASLSSAASQLSSLGIAVLTLVHSPSRSLHLYETKLCALGICCCCCCHVLSLRRFSHLRLQAARV
jgi:hypothetical protein